MIACKFVSVRLFNRQGFMKKASVMLGWKIKNLTT